MEISPYFYVFYIKHTEFGDLGHLTHYLNINGPRALVGRLDLELHLLAPSERVGPLELRMVYENVLVTVLDLDEPIASAVHPVLYYSFQQFHLTLLRQNVDGLLMPPSIQRLL